MMDLNLEHLDYNFQSLFSVRTMTCLTQIEFVLFLLTKFYFYF